MATITFTLSATALTRLVDATSTLYKYQTTINGSPNPETKAQFAQRIWREIMKDFVKEFEQQKQLEIYVNTNIISPIDIT